MRIAYSHDTLQAEPSYGAYALKKIKQKEIKEALLAGFSHEEGHENGRKSSRAKVFEKCWVRVT